MFFAQLSVRILPKRQSLLPEFKLVLVGTMGIRCHRHHRHHRNPAHAGLLLGAPS